MDKFRRFQTFLPVANGYDHRIILRSAVESFFGERFDDLDSGLESFHAGKDAAVRRHHSVVGQDSQEGKIVPG